MSATDTFPVSYSTTAVLALKFTLTFLTPGSPSRARRTRGGHE